MTFEDRQFIRQVAEKDAKDTRKDIATMLGHVLLHMGFFTNDSAWKAQSTDRFQTFCNKEKLAQADEFAMSILMPYQELFRYAATVIYNEDTIADVNI